MNFLSTLKKNEKDLILTTIIILVALISFGLGRLSKIREQKVPITITQMSADAGEVLGSSTNVMSKTEFHVAPVTETRLQGIIADQYVASKNGTKYHFPWCSGAKRIKESNKIWFNTIEEARKAGYTPASNCKGLE